MDTPPTPPAVPNPSKLCPQCHQPIAPEFYFCPNCGKKLSEPPLATDGWAQVQLYGLSIIMPLICYLAIGYWKGIRYARSDDPKARQMGWIAIALIIISSVVLFWLTAVWLNSVIQETTSSLGSLGSGL